MIAIGDIHGKFDVIANFIRYVKIDSTPLIQVGDFGVGFSKNEKKELNILNDVLADHNNKLYVIRGNHDDPSYFTYDGNNRSKYSNIFFIKDHTLLNIDGKNIYFVGGAISIDRNFRKEGIDYWSNEHTNYIPIKQIKNKLKKADFIITHDAPIYAYPTLLEIPSDKKLTSDIFKNRKYFSDFYKYLKEGVVWLYGHYHKSHTNSIKGVKYCLLSIDEFRQI